MKKQYLIIFSCVMLLGLIAGIYQYVEEFKSEFINAYSGKPPTGHSWSEMECTAGLCVTTDNKVGIGTYTPAEKLEVAGNLKVTGDICNNTGNCLSALANLTNACGTAAKTYVYSATALSGTYCFLGNPTPAATSLSLPSAGSSISWTCPVTSGNPISCTATHAVAPVNGVCGSSNNQTLTVKPTTNLCSTGTTSTVSGSGPWAWNCAGTDGGSTAQCLAYYGVSPVCGSANGTTFISSGGANCSVGTVANVSKNTYGSSYTWSWNCYGLGSLSSSSVSCSAWYGHNGCGGAYTSEWDTDYHRVLCGYCGYVGDPAGCASLTSEGVALQDSGRPLNNRPACAVNVLVCW